MIKKNKNLNIFIGIILIIVISIPIFYYQFKTNLIFSIDKGYELTFDNPIKNGDLEKKLDKLKPNKILMLSQVNKVNINEKIKKVRYIKGNLEYFSNEQSKDVSNIKTTDKLIIYLNRKLSYELFNTLEIGRQSLLINNLYYQTNGKLDLKSFQWKKGEASAFLSFDKNEENKEIKKVFISNENDEGKKINLNELTALLNELGDFDLLNYQSIQLKIFKEFEGYKAIILLIFISKLYKFLKDNKLKKAMIILVGIIFLISTIKFELLPLEWIDEEIVELSFYLDKIKSLPDIVYNILTNSYSYGYFMCLWLTYKLRIIYLLSIYLVLKYIKGF